jgi:VanZ family protein
LKINEGFVGYQIPFFAWALGIFVASSIPGEDFPNWSIFSQDKLLHFIVFFGFALLLERALHHQLRWPSLSRRSHLVTFVVAVLYGSFDELHQFFVPGRNPDVFDLCADTAGAVVAVFVVWALTRRRSLPAKE